MKKLLILGMLLFTTESYAMSSQSSNGTSAKTSGYEYEILCIGGLSVIVIAPKSASRLAAFYQKDANNDFVRCKR